MPEHSSQPELIHLPTEPGHTVAARVFLSPQQATKGVCILAPATGVAQYLYDDFARWLNAQGYHAVTFDYDGIGLSVTGHVRDSQSDMLTWAEYDGPAVLRYAGERFAGDEIIWIGHSIGGHLLGMMPDTGNISRAITVGSGTGTWWLNSPPTRRVSWLLWGVIVPVTVPLAGYFPGKRLKMMCDLPRGVIWQWRRWCLRREYCVGAEGDWLRQRFAAVRVPIDSVYFSDDEMMSPANVRDLHGFFSNAPQTQTVIQPADVGMTRIGHIGWHRERFRPVWEQVFLPILQPVTAAA